MAQSVQQDGVLRVPYSLESLPTKRQATNMPVGHRAEGDTIFYEDFANGFNGNTSFGAWTFEGTNGDVWRHSIYGPTGAYSNTTQIIGSTSAANGFMIFASDSANTNWSANPPVIVGTPVNLEGSLVSPLLDLSAYTYVSLQFEQRLRWCCGTTDAPHRVEVSTDGGATWTEIANTGNATDVNQLSPTQLLQYNISDAIAADPANVKIRFRHNADAATSHYFWQIDDVLLFELPQYDIRLDYGFVSNLANAMEYGRIPLDQFENNNVIYVGGGYNNFGWNQDHTNIALDVEVRDAGDNVVAQTTVNPTLENEELIPVALPATTLAPGLHTVDFTLYSDQEPVGGPFFSSNTVPTRHFEVTADPNAVYSLDNIDNHPDDQLVVGSIGSNSFDNNHEGMIVFTQYNVSTPRYVHGLDIRIARGTSGTTVGTQISIALYDSLDIFADTASYTPNLTNPIAESLDLYEITQQDSLNGIISLDFPAPVLLEDHIYYAGVQLYGSETSRVRILDDMTVPQPGWASLMYLPNSPAAGNPANRVWSNGNALAIRLVSNLTVGIDELARNAEVSLYPNPTNGLTRFDYTLHTDAPVTIEFTDIAGKLVKTFYEGQRAAGEHRLQFDTTNLGEGVYLYTLRADEARTTGRMVVVK